MPTNTAHEFFFWTAVGLTFGLGLGLADLYVATPELRRLLPSALLAALFLLTYPYTRKQPGCARFIISAACACLCILLGSDLLMGETFYVHASWTRCTDTLINGREILKIWLLSHGQNIYPGMKDFPFLVTLYTPGYYAVCSALFSALGDLVLSASVVSFLSLVGLVLAMAVWLRRETDRTGFAAAIAGLFLVDPHIVNSGLLVRPDFLAWFLVVLGAYLFLAPCRKNPSRARVLTGCITLCLGPLFKQQTVPVTLACITVCLIAPILWKRCLFLLVSGLIIGGVSFELMQLSTDGNFLTHCIIYPVKLAGSPSITNWSNAAGRIQAFTKQEFALLGLCFIILIQGVIQRRLHVLDWIILVQIPFILRLIMTWGAADNYWWGLLATVFLRVGVYLGQVARKGSDQYSLALIGLLALCPPSPSLADWGTAFSSAQPDTADLRLAAIVRQIASGDVLVNSEASPPLLSREFSRRLQFFDSIETEFFEKVGLWRFSDSKMAVDISDKRFAVIVLGKTFINPAIPIRILNYYRPDQVIGPYTIYTPLSGHTITYPIPTEQLIESSPLKLHVCKVEGVYVNQTFGAFSISKTEYSNTGSVIFVLNGHSAMRSVLVRLYPKIVHFGPGNKIVCEWSDDGVNYKNFFIYQGTPGDMQMSLSEPNVEARFYPASQEVFIRFVLQGSAQLWFNQDMPFAFIADN
jgi:hypothetical protein